MLKDFKYSSHVLCEKNLENLTNDAIVIERLDIDPRSDDGDNVRVRRDHGRHYAPSHLDMRDIMSPDIYHRYDLIVKYLQVFIPFIIRPFDSKLRHNANILICDIFRTLHPATSLWSCWSWAGVTRTDPSSVSRLAAASLVPRPQAWCWTAGCTPGSGSLWPRPSTVRL